MITPFFGDLPEWFDKFESPKGYQWILDTDFEGFKERVKSKLGIEYPGLPGTGKVWDYRCALGLLYEEEISGFDYWGHMDMDCVWGEVDKFIPDSELSNLEIYSSHHEYVCGCFSLYRNHTIVNELFKTVPDWKSYMDQPEPNGWVEQAYSRALEQSGLRYAYTFNQGNPWDKEPILRKEGDRLYQQINFNWQEIMFFHFRHSKRWPL